MAAFLAQVAHESGGFNFVKEGLSYSAVSLNKVFKKYFPTVAAAKAYERQPAKIANKVYASRMGNGPESSGDGYKFCGRGLIQLTGKDNYTRFAKSIGKTLDEAVAYLETSDGAVASAGWFWDANKLSVYADNKYSRDYIIILDRVQSLIERKKEILKSIEEPNKDIFTFSDFYSETEDNATLKDLIIQFIEHQRNKYAHSYDKIQNDKKVDYNDFEKIKYFKDNYVRMINIINSFYEIIKKKTIVYLGAGTARQSALFSIRDKNNALAQAIHDFYQLRIQPGEEANLFVKEWMSNFEIGEQYEIELHAGEAYEVNIRSQSKRIPMADMGMGSIQAMLLIIRLATIIHNSKKSNKSYSVVIEEPELNLHPALQSQLASMFHHVHVKYRINLIVETHSEYLIRKTQLIVK
jgi:hypothetical protein